MRSTDAPLSLRLWESLEVGDPRHHVANFDPSQEQRTIHFQLDHSPLTPNLWIYSNSQMASLLLTPSRQACHVRILGIRSFAVSTSVAKKHAKKHSGNVATNSPSPPLITSSSTTTPPPPPKQTKNPFTAPANANSVLAYVGPYASTLRQCKSVAFVFGACGCIAVPSTLYLGNTEHVLAIMGKREPSNGTIFIFFFQK